MSVFLKQRVLPVALCLCMLLALTQAYGFTTEAANACAPQVSVGKGFMVALASDGTAYAWGDNFMGMLGNGTQTDSKKPVKVIMPEGVKFVSVSAGWNHVLALSSEGKLYAWGSNAYGQLGREWNETVTAPKEISFPSSQPIVSVAAGNSFSLALTADGSVYAWGTNGKGQLGVSVSEMTQSSVPRKIEALSEVFITSVYAGNTTASAISSDGNVWLWGDNENGQCGSSSSSVVLPTQKKSSSPYFATQMALGDSHSSLLDLSGEIKSFGVNQYGQFGNSQEVSDLIDVTLNKATLPEGVIASSVASGKGHSVFLDSLGEVYSFGYNDHGQLGYSGSSKVVAPQKVEIPMEGSAKAVALDACGCNTAVVDSNGFVWTWGENTDGQLGNDSYSESYTPVCVVGEEGSGRLSLGRAPKTEIYTANITVKATVPAPSYYMEIPSAVSVGNLTQTDVREDNSHIVSTDIQIAAKDVDHLFSEKMILVTVNTEDGKFELADGDFKLPYSIYGSLNSDPLSPGDEFAVFMGDQSATGRIEFDRSLITREGSYRGTLIFEVSVNDLSFE